MTLTETVIQRLENKIRRQKAANCRLEESTRVLRKHVEASFGFGVSTERRRCAEVARKYGERDPVVGDWCAEIAATIEADPKDVNKGLVAENASLVDVINTLQKVVCYWEDRWAKMSFDARSELKDLEH